MVGSALGIISYGSIRKRLSSVAAFLDMKVLVHDPYITIAGKHAHKASFQDVLAGAGFLTCLAFAADETENLMKKAAFSALKQGSYFINIPWKNFVDEATSEAVLNTGHLAGAALDVGQAPDQMPNPSLAVHPNLITTSHMGVQTPQSTELKALETVEQVRSLLVQYELPHNALNPEHAHGVHAYLHEKTCTS